LKSICGIINALDITLTEQPNGAGGLKK